MQWPRGRCPFGGRGQHARHAEDRRGQVPCVRHRLHLTSLRLAVAARAWSRSTCPSCRGPQRSWASCRRNHPAPSAAFGERQQSRTRPWIESSESRGPPARSLRTPWQHGGGPAEGSAGSSVRSCGRIVEATVDDLEVLAWPKSSPTAGPRGEAAETTIPPTRERGHA